MRTAFIPLVFRAYIRYLDHTDNKQTAWAPWAPKAPAYVPQVHSVDGQSTVVKAPASRPPTSDIQTALKTDEDPKQTRLFRPAATHATSVDP